MAISAIIFDLDDTLMPDVPADADALLATSRFACDRYNIDPKNFAKSVRSHANQLWQNSSTYDYCLAMGISASEALWAKFIGDYPNFQTLRDWTPQYRTQTWTRALADYNITDDDLVRQLIDHFAKERLSRSILFDGAKKIMEDFSKKFELAMITNGVPDLQIAKLNASSIASYFKTAVFSGEHGVGKPDRRIFELVLEKLNAPPSQTAMIGNSLKKDVGGAQNAGIKGIWFNPKNQPPDSGITPDAQIQTLAQLPDVLKTMSL